MKTKRSILKGKRTKAKLRESSLGFLLLTVFCLGFASCTAAPAPETITREQLLEEPADTRNTLDKLLRTPVDLRDRLSSSRFAVLRKECSFAYSQEPVYTLELGEQDVSFYGFIHSFEFIIGSDGSLRWTYGIPEPPELIEPQLFRCSKEEFDSVEIGDFIRIEGAIHREYKIGVIFELVKNYGPMIYHRDGLIYYLYHTPAE